MEGSGGGKIIGPLRNGTLEIPLCFESFDAGFEVADVLSIQT